MIGCQDIYDQDLPSHIAGANKIASMRFLRAWGLRTPEGFAIWEDTPGTRTEMLDALHERGWSRFLMRTDGRGTPATTPPGGYMVRQENSGLVLEQVLDRGCILLILEPHDRFRNLYGANVGFFANDEGGHLEVVGPGFDVGDLNRGLQSPHEWTMLDSREGRLSPRPGGWSRIDEKAYKDAIDSRSQFVSSQPAWKGVEASLTPELPASYVPMPDGIRRALLKDVRELPMLLQAMGISAEASLSASYVMEPPEGWLYWDVAVASRKYSR